MLTKRIIYAFNAKTCHIIQYRKRVIRRGNVLSSAKTYRPMQKHGLLCKTRYSIPKTCHPMQKFIIQCRNRDIQCRKHFINCENILFDIKNLLFSTKNELSNVKTYHQVQNVLFNSKNLFSDDIRCKMIISKQKRVIKYQKIV